MLLSVTRPRDGRPGVRFPAEEKYFFLKSVKIWQSYSLSKGAGGGTVSPGVKGQGHDADHAPASSSEFRNQWSYTSSPPPPYMPSRRTKAHLCQSTCDTKS